MSEKKRTTLFSVLSIVGTACIFFLLGMVAAERFGLVEKRYVMEQLSPETTTTVKVSVLIDLNTATVEDLMQIDGIGEKTAQNIINYREKIGGFDYVEQLLYVDGIGESKYKNWAPYLTVGGVESHPQTTTQANSDGITTTTTTVSKITVELNTATVEELMQIDGVGERTAHNIIAFRDSVGGFVRLEQLLEVDGIGETKFRNWAPYLTVNGVGLQPTTTSVRATATTATTAHSGKYHLNYVTKEELMSIDGVGEKIADSIIAYREQNGGFTDMKQLMKIEGIGENRFAVLCKYLTLED